MFVTVKDVAQELKLPEKFIMEKILEGKVKTVFDGEEVLVNKAQFDKLIELIEKKREQMIAEYNEPLPEDYDVKDED